MTERGPERWAIRTGPTVRHLGAFRFGRQSSLSRGGRGRDWNGLP
jgi:hypothetical protein